MKKVFVQPISVGNGRFTYDLLDLNGGFAGSNEFQYATLGEAYEAGICHAQEWPESFTLVSPAAVADVLSSAVQHLYTLRAFEEGYNKPTSDGLEALILKIEELLFV